MIGSEEQFQNIVEQLIREEVAPKFNEWRNPYAYKIAYGGRGAGAKTESAMSLAVQFGENPQYFGNRVNILITRETQNTIDLSSFEAVKKKVMTLGYSDWRITNKYIENKKNGSRISFRGLSDLTADNFRSLQDVDILICEEAHGIGYKAWNTVLPSMRKAKAEVWVLFNRVLEVDPCYDLFVLNERPGSCILALEPGNIDNPWFDLSSLPEKREADYKRDPDEAAHIWEGLPRKQGVNAVMSRTDVLAAMERNIENPEGDECVGVDVARFGSDSTQIYRRKGLKTIDGVSMRGFDTMAVSDKAYAVGAIKVPYNIDGGYNPGVIDVLRSRGRDVHEINFGSTKVNNPDLYANIATEMWFEFPIKEADIPNDRELLVQLTDRRYGYDKKGRKIIESKDLFKKRNGGKSPDCFISGTMVKTINGDKPIETIKEGDFVYTPFGIQRVIRNWETETEELTTVSFNNGRSLTGKGNHRVYTNYGFIPASNLQGYMIESFSWRKILSWQVKSLFYTKARSISFKQAVDTIQPGKSITERDFFTGSFGLNQTDQYQKDTLFTILIRIGATMIYPILRWLRLASTFKNTWKNTIQSKVIVKSINCTLRALEPRLVNGMDLKKVKNGILNMEKNHGLEEKKAQLFVQRVVKSFKHSLDQGQNTVQNHAQTNMQENTAGQQKKYVQYAVKSILRKIKTLRKFPVVADHVEQSCVGKTSVYNLTLEKHNVYYANGILVENCADALILAYYQPHGGFDEDIRQEMAALRSRQ